MRGFFDIQKTKVRAPDQPFFPYRGCKARLRKSIVRWTQIEGSSYVEPFAGRGNLFFLMKAFAKFKTWHLNDTQTIPFFEALLSYDGSPLPELTKEEAKNFYKRNDPLFQIMEPIIYWAGGLADMRCSPTGARGHDLIEYRKRVLSAQKLLRGVEFTNVDALQIMRRYLKDPKAFLYIDPPYLNANVGSYTDGMIDRVGMLKLLKRARFRWLLSEYYCQDIVDMFGEPLTQIKNVIINPSPGGGSTRREVECLWSNYPMKPLTIDFGYWRKGWELISVSHQILRTNLKISFEDWKKLVPKKWSESTVGQQWHRLIHWRDYYFDGECVYHPNFWETRNA